MKYNITLADLIRVNYNFDMLESVKFDGVQYAERIETTCGSYVVLACPCVSKKQIKEVGAKHLNDVYANFKIELFNFVDLLIRQRSANDHALRFGEESYMVESDASRTIVSQFRYILKILGFEKSEILQIMFVDENGEPRNNMEVVNYLMTSVLPLFFSADMVGKKSVITYAENWSINKGYFIPSKNIAMFEGWLGARLNNKKLDVFSVDSVKDKKKSMNINIKREKESAREMEIHRALVQMNAIKTSELVEAVPEKKTTKRTKKSVEKTTDPVEVK